MKALLKLLKKGKIGNKRFCRNPKNFIVLIFFCGMSHRENVGRAQPPPPKIGQIPLKFCPI